MAWVALVLLVLSQIRTLKVLAPVSLAANISMVVGQAIIWYYIFRDLPPIHSRPLVGPISGLPKFMGIVLFAMESLGVIIALENNMADPAAFTGPFGILNAGMAVVITLYAVLGFFGFYQYGDDVQDVITLSLPVDWTGQSVKVIYALAIVLTYPLQMWPVLEITWGKYVSGYLLQRDDRWYELWESLYRAALVLLT
ncbi:proton-coupled amino acid transporter-like protein CG1139, partial [Frankliniella occidentalis]|uniref:Proton-coupled amino acid transporter-like protein CG1139 n=1 Tax=Frankliniella occidentalis TaxID=133901 RepID=A0A9C6XW76_FRAOC